MENKIDRLFKDKLARHHVSPAPQAWEQVKDEMDGATKPRIWWSIAASVILLAVSSLLLFRSSESTDVVYVAVVTPDQPMPLAEYEWDLAKPKQDVMPIEIPKPKPIKPKPISKKAFANVIVTEETVTEIEEVETTPELLIVNPDKLEAVVALDEVLPEMTNPMEVASHFQVQITYQASEAPIIQKEEKTKVGELFAKARQIRSGEMLASLRETKNDFFSRKRN